MDASDDTGQGAATTEAEVPAEFQVEPATPDDVRVRQSEVREAQAEDRDLIRRAAAHGSAQAEAQNSRQSQMAEELALSPDEQVSALDWFMQDEVIDAEQTIDLNIGTTRNRRWIAWTIRAVDTDVLKRIRRDAEGNRARRRGRTEGAGDIDPQEANLRIVLAGTIEPDLREICRMKGAPEHVDPDVAPLQLLKHRFRTKPGLIDQIAGEVMSLSGYDEDDLREHMAGKA